MGKKFSLFIVALLALNLLISPVSAEDLLKTDAIFGTPEIDAEKDDIWDGANVIKTERYVEGSDAAWAEVRTMWDEENLYVYAEVHDGSLSVKSENDWEQDSVEVFLDQNNAKSATFEDDDGQYRVNYENKQSYGGVASADNFTTATKTTDFGYVVEAAIKLASAASEGTVFGFDFQINDDKDDDGVRDAVIIWNDSSGQSFQNTSGFGELTLVKEAASDETPAAGEEGEKLPNTSTAMYNILALGLVSITLGGFVLFKMKKRTA
nr:sugar-binding protein [Paenibacillus bovis]